MASASSSHEKYGKFAAKIMAKHGWEQGQGLGANNQGRSDIVKPSLKFDVSGVGHDPAKEFTDHWWDVAYTKAARRIAVTHDQSTGDVTVESRKRTSKKQLKEESKRRKQGLYAKFVKSATLTNGQEVKEKQEPDHEGATEQERLEEEQEEREARAKVISRLSDEELFHACDGMTAHKGARHGHRMSGKQARLEAMEKKMMQELNKKSQEQNHKQKRMKKKKGKEAKADPVKES